MDMIIGTVVGVVVTIISYIRYEIKDNSDSVMNAMFSIVTGFLGFLVGVLFIKVWLYFVILTFIIGAFYLISKIVANVKEKKRNSLCPHNCDWDYCPDCRH